MKSLEVLFGAHIKVKQNINLFIKITYLLSKLKPFTCLHGESIFCIFCFNDDLFISEKERAWEQGEGSPEREISRLAAQQET